jgi:hypothetical protein
MSNNFSFFRVQIRYENKMGNDDYNNFVKELKAINPKAKSELVTTGSNHQIDKKQFIGAGVTFALLWIILVIWTPSWLKSSGKKNYLFITIISFIIGIAVGVAMYFLV